VHAILITSIFMISYRSCNSSTSFFFWIYKFIWFLKTIRLFEFFFEVHKISNLALSIVTIVSSLIGYFSQSLRSSALFSFYSFLLSFRIYRLSNSLDFSNNRQSSSVLTFLSTVQSSAIYHRNFLPIWSTIGAFFNKEYVSSSKWMPGEPCLLFYSI